MRLLFFEIYKKMFKHVGSVSRAGLSLKQRTHVFRASRGKVHHKTRLQGNLFYQRDNRLKNILKIPKIVGKIKFNVRHLTIMLNLGIKGSCQLLHYASERCGDTVVGLYFGPKLALIRSLVYHSPNTLPIMVHDQAFHII